MSVRLQDIAVKAGVDKSTVSRVLSGKASAARISQERIDAVLRVAETLQFRPNSAAVAVSKGRFDAIALVLGTAWHSSSLPEAMQEGIHDALAEREMHLLLTRLPDRRLTDESFVPRILRTNCCDGLLINYTHYVPNGMLELVERHRIPSIWLNTDLDHDCVHPDDRGAGEAAARWLLERGHRRIAFADFSHDERKLAEVHYSVRHRQQGYEQAMRQAGLQPQVFRSERMPAQIPPILDALFAGPLPPTALITHGDWHAQVAALVLTRRGLAVGRDVELVTFGAKPITLGDVPIRTLTVPQRQLGRLAVETLLEKIAHPARRLPPRVIPFEIPPP
jgi:LacI family transcriptional regulator